MMANELTLAVALTAAYTLYRSSYTGPARLCLDKSDWLLSHVDFGAYPLYAEERDDTPASAPES